MHRLEILKLAIGIVMADNQKRDNKGRFKSKPKSAPAPSSLSVPGRPSVKPEKEKIKKKIVRLVKNPDYQPIAASRTMEDALQPVKDARTKKKRDKARKQMESTFGDIDWDEKNNQSEFTQRSQHKDNRQATSEVAAENEGDSNPAALLDERFNTGRDSDNTSGSQVKASLREELIVNSGAVGEVWILDKATQEFYFSQSEAKLKFVYAEDSYSENTPDWVKGQDHVTYSVEDGEKTLYAAIGAIAFIVNG
jgi:hypothetical protein